MRPLRRRHVTLAEGVGVVVFEAKDPGKAVDEAIVNKTPAPYGAVLWDSAVDVARALRHMDLAGKSVLELGCGCGLCGIVAALGGAEVHCTDVDEQVLAAVHEGAREQNVADRVTTGSFDVCGADPLPAADVVVIADLLYEPLLAGGCARRVLEAVGRGATVVVGDPDRAGRQDFIKLVRAGGVDVEFTGNVAVFVGAVR